VQLACHRTASVSCCGDRNLDSTRAFAMPCNGQCPNVGRVEGSQGLTRIVEKNEAQISRLRSGLRELVTVAWITDRYPRSVRSRRV
jgi:hypothetical protein